ncbi:L,D-transpeptidase [Pseudorhodoplanes sp.]|uniref:L,D-transpeptidase n=1 Tax=Pseudorhodoplanes sp. TaxID=1934341 RepID=UPI002BD2CC34|nr:L,D-transpeptidase family protein [Pseudorhodoplanes sp.]HWV51838.1 L,D-transpeptidase family protein [Pseudorhodoplanes sp.]
MRRLVLLSSLATFGFAVAEPAWAQYSYPPGGYSGGDRMISIDPDDDDDRLPPPGAAPRGAYEPSVTSQPLPPTSDRGNYPYDLHPRVTAPGTLPPPPDRNYVTRAPGYGEPAPGVYAPPPPGGAYAPPPQSGTYGSQPPAAYGSPPPGVYGAPSQGAYAPPPAGNPYAARQDGAPRPPMAIEPGRQVAPGTTGSIAPGQIASLPPEDQPEVGKPKELPPQFRRQVVDYKTKEPAGTIIIDTPSTFLYYVNGDGTAIRYGIGVGRDGFTWAGTEKITRMAEWPDWHPPAEMIERQPYLPRFMAGGESNPMGARALYLGKTIYRVHGTNQPSTIGQFVSSGCIRMLNEDVMDLYTRVKVGTKVVVLGDGGKSARNSNTTATR